MGSSVGTATRLLSVQPTNRGSIPGRGNHCRSLRNLQTASGAYPASNSVDIGALSRRQIGREVSFLPIPSGAEVKNEWSCASSHT